MDKPQERRAKRTGKLVITCHLVSDLDLDELHSFAQSIGVGPKGFHDKPGQPHYDLIEPYISRALDRGVQVVSPKRIVQILERYGGNTKM